MAKLEKSFQDYFRIPVLLKSVGKTTDIYSISLTNILNNLETNLPLDQRYQRDQVDPNAQILSQRSQFNNIKLYFRNRDFDNDWPQLEVIYWCKFVIGVLNPKQQSDIEAAIKRVRKSVKDENRRLIGIIIYGALENIPDMDGMIFLPDGIPETQIWSFLQPTMYAFLKTIENMIIQDIVELKWDSNQIIVFNKNEQRPDPKTLKKKKKGRCLKLAADYYLMIGLVLQAYKTYLEAEDIFKKIDDYVWLLGCLQGKMACMTSDCQLPVKQKYQQFQKLSAESKQIGRKMKIWSLECQNHFKIFRIFKNDPQYLDDLISSFLSENQRFNIDEDLFNIYLQIGNIYQNAGLIRRRNYYFYFAAILYYQKKPQFSFLLLKEVKHNNLVKKWPQLYSKLIKLIIDLHLGNFNGQLHLELLQNCYSRLTKKDIDITIDTLNFSNFLEVNLNRSTSLLKINNFALIQSNIKPKVNRLVHSLQQSSSAKGFFMSWKKKQEKLLYQFNEVIKAKGAMFNQMSFPIRTKIIIPIANKKYSITLYLPPQMSTPFQIQFKVTEEDTKNKLVIIDRIYFQVWNFIFCQKQQKPIQIQFYQQMPKLIVKLNQVLLVEKSSAFEFDVSVTKQKTHICCQKIRLTVSVYYNIDVGFQENEYYLQDISQALTIKEYYEGQQSNKSILKLKPFRQNRSYLKKIEVSLDYITSSSHKYQITIIESAKCQSIQSVWCEYVSITSVHKQHQLNPIQNIIQNYYLLTFRLHKDKYDLAPYKAYILNKQYTLSSQTDIQIMEQFTKNQSTNDIKIPVKWINMTSPSQKGQFEFIIPYHPAITKSNKQVKLTVKDIKLQGTQLKKIIIQYQVIGINLSHQVFFNPMIYQEKKQFIMKGKNRINTTKDKLNNVLEVIFYAKYPQNYVIKIKFDDGMVYYYDDLITTHY